MGDGGGRFRDQWRALPPWLRASLASVVGVTVAVAVLWGAIAASHRGHRAASSSTTSSSPDATDTTLPVLALGTSTTASTAPPPTTSTTASTTTTTRPTTTTAPATTVPFATTTTSRPAAAAFCAASMSNPFPPEPRGSSTTTDTVQVSSNLARAQVAVTAHYATGPSSRSSATDSRGSASIPLTFDRSQAPRGFTVFVDVSVGAGAAVCRTSFTTQ